MNRGSENPTVPRFVPEEALPPYSFVPGQSPHPVSDPAGHSFGKSPGTFPSLDRKRWEASKPYLFGIDLFNRQYFWESHEQWEGLWHASGRSGAVADFLKGLIKLAAAGVKHLEGKPKGVKSHALRAVALWQRVARSLGENEEFFLGLRMAELISLAAAMWQEGWPPSPVLLVPTLPQN
jgi:predicted metal-dependent hydrolase